jgi:hypothetical protein
VSLVIVAQQTVPEAQLAELEHFKAAVSPGDAAAHAGSHANANNPPPAFDTQQVSAGMLQVAAPQVRVVAVPPGPASRLTPPSTPPARTPPLSPPLDPAPPLSPWPLLAPGPASDPPSQDASTSGCPVLPHPEAVPTAKRTRPPARALRRVKGSMEHDSCSKRGHLLSSELYFALEQPHARGPSVDHPAPWDTTDRSSMYCVVRWTTCGGSRSRIRRPRGEGVRLRRPRSPNRTGRAPSSCRRHREPCSLAYRSRHLA